MNILQKWLEEAGIKPASQDSTEISFSIGDILLYEPPADFQNLTDDEVKTELEKLKSLLNLHSVNLKSIAKYPDRIIYEFILSELLQQRYINGTEITYENFHPEPVKYISDRCDEIVRSLFDGEWKQFEILSDYPVIVNDRSYHENELPDFYNKFFSRFDESTILGIEIKNIKIDNDEAEVDMILKTIPYNGCISPEEIPVLIRLKKISTSWLMTELKGFM